MTPSSHGAELRRLYERFGIDDSASRSPYVASFEKEMAALSWRAGDAGAALDAARAANVVLLGEFHPLPTACGTAVDLLSDAAVRGVPPPVIGLEMIHARDQRALDAYLAGTIGERELFRRIRYREEWGYPTSGPRRLLRYAREHRVEVCGLDVPPRGSAADLALRDEVAAERIAARVANGAEGRILAIYGEAHAAAANLPQTIAAHVPRAVVVRMFHDLELEGSVGVIEANGAEWLSAGNGTFSRQRAPRGARLRALATVFESWAADAPPRAALDLSLLAHELIDGLASLVEIDPRLHRVAPGRFLADLYPEVYGAAERRRADRRMREVASSGAALWTAAVLGGVHYDERANLLLVAEPSMPAFAIECGLFLCRALRAAPDWPERGASSSDPAERAADLALGSALASMFDPSIAATDPPEELGALTTAPDGAAIAALLTRRPSMWRRTGRWLGSSLAAALAANRLAPASLREPVARPARAKSRLDWIAEQFDR